MALEMGGNDLGQLIAVAIGQASATQPVIGFARGILEEYNSEKIQKLDKQFHEDKIQTIESLIEAINNLNPNKGRKVTIKEILHVPKPYSCDAKKSDFRIRHDEYFDADKLKVETKEGEFTEFTIVLPIV